jgi:hypothetical protein
MELGFSKWVLAFALSSWLLFSRAYSGEPVFVLSLLIVEFLTF